MPRAGAKSITGSPVSPAMPAAAGSRALPFLAAEDLLDPVTALDLQRLIAAAEQRPVAGVVAGHGIELEGEVLVQLRRDVHRVVGAGEVPHGHRPKCRRALGPHP